MSTISTKWTPKKRDYVSEHKQFNKPTTATTTHPLGIGVINADNKVGFASTLKFSRNGIFLD